MFILFTSSAPVGIRNMDTNNVMFNNWYNDDIAFDKKLNTKTINETIEENGLCHTVLK